MESARDELERYLQRNPCILDTSADYIRQRQWLLVSAALLLFGVCVLTTRPLLAEMGVVGFRMRVRELLVLVDVLLYMSVVWTNPGKPSARQRRDCSLGGWCSICRAHRPRRSHHCKTCAQCVLLRDHHCFWVNTCIGKQNVKNFVLFNLLTASLALYALLVTFEYFFMFARRELYIATLFVNLIVLPVVCGGTAYMFSRQVYLVAHNLTGRELRDQLEASGRANVRSDRNASNTQRRITQELVVAADEEQVRLFTHFRLRMLGESAPNDASDTNDSFQFQSLRANPFDKGWYANVCEIMGSSIWLWFVPSFGRPLRQMWVGVRSYFKPKRSDDDGGDSERENASATTSATAEEDIMHQHRKQSKREYEEKRALIVHCRCGDNGRGTTTGADAIV